MCGRFYIEEEDNEEILRIVRRLDERFQQEKKSKVGEVYPTNEVTILTQKQNNLLPLTMAWGFPGFKGSKIIINARSESAHEKQMFSESLQTKRIVIPASGFFEWDHSSDKQKYYFKDPVRRILYMGGLYQEFEDTARFVILTTAANDSMKAIHNRMPVLLKEEEINPFILDFNAAKGILNRIPSPLDKECISRQNKETYEQLTFDFK